MPYTQKVADTLKKVVTSVNAEMPGAEADYFVWLLCKR